MKIVFDTNILYDDFFLKRAQIVDICETARQYNIEVYIPEVVYDEIINQYGEKIDEIEKEIDSSVRKVRSISTTLSLENIINGVTKKQLLDEYPSILDKRLEELDIKILPYPSTSHKDIVARDLKRRRPFQKSGKGYRDALIWETILSIADDNGENPDVIFINKNTHDFFEKNELHQDLKEDLRKKGLSAECFIIYETLRDAIDNHIRPLQERFQALLKTYSGCSTIEKVDINKYLSESIETDIEMIINSEDSYLLGIKSYIENPAVLNIEDVKATIKDIHHISAAQIIVDVEADVLVNLEGYLFKGDYPLLSDEDIPTIIDSDWNRHYMLVWDTIKFPVKISLVVDSELTQVLNYSIDAY